jgi:hypothetical protein
MTVEFTVELEGFRPVCRNGNVSSVLYAVRTALNEVQQLLGRAKLTGHQIFFWSWGGLLRFLQKFCRLSLRDFSIDFSSWTAHICSRTLLRPKTK